MRISPALYLALISTAMPLVAQPPQAAPLAPQSVEEKFVDYAIEAFGPRSLVAPTFSTGIRMIHPRKAYPREWRLGGGAFGRNYGNALAEHASLQTGRFVVGALLHEDFRYRPAKSTNAAVRLAHAVAFTFVDRSDSGHNQIAFGNFAGAASEGFVGNLYLPRGFNNVSHAETRMAFAFGGLAIRNITKEFAPEIFKVSRKLHIPLAHLPIPEWWVPLKH